MNGHTILLLIAIVCELGATGVGVFYPEGNKFNMMALGLLFYFISLLVV